MNNYGPKTTIHHPRYLRGKSFLVNHEILPEHERFVHKVPGENVIDVGCGEGLLSLALVKAGKVRVTGIDVTPVRIEAAVELKELWRQHGWLKTGQLDFIEGDIFEHLDLLADAETFVAERFIYHLGSSLDSLFESLAANIHNLVLMGSSKRQNLFRKNSQTSLGEDAFYSSIEGMVAVCLRHDFRVTDIIVEGDPVVFAENNRLAR